MDMVSAIAGAAAGLLTGLGIGAGIHYEYKRSLLLKANKGISERLADGNFYRLVPEARFITMYQAFKREQHNQATAVPDD